MNELEGCIKDRCRGSTELRKYWENSLTMKALVHDVQQCFSNQSSRTPRWSTVLLPPKVDLLGVLEYRIEKQSIRETLHPLLSA